jgi:cytoskeletal protein CcmA (bactofilin family)
MWKDMFANPKTNEEEEASMLEDFKRPRPIRPIEEGGTQRPSDRVSSFLDQGTEFEGKLAFEGAVRVNGKFSGEIFSEGTLYIGENGVVHAEIQVDTVIISGEVTGNVTATSKVELQRSGRLRGNIRTQALKIDEGAIFEGNCQMRAEEQAASRRPVASRSPASEAEAEQKGLELT